MLTRSLNYAFCYEALDKITDPFHQLMKNTFGDVFEAAHVEWKTVQYKRKAPRRGRGVLRRAQLSTGGVPG